MGVQSRRNGPAQCRPRGGRSQQRPPSAEERGAPVSRSDVMISSRKVLIMLLVAAVAVSACFSASEVLTEDDLRSIYVQAIDRVCAEAGPYGGCSERVEVSERFDAGFDPVENPAEVPMPRVVRETIEAELPHAVSSSIATGDGGVRLLIGPYEMVRDGIVAVQVGYTCGGTCGAGRILYFERDDGAWEPTTPDAVGEPDRRWVA